MSLSLLLLGGLLATTGCGDDTTDDSGTTETTSTTDTDQFIGTVKDPGGVDPYEGTITLSLEAAMPVENGIDFNGSIASGEVAGDGSFAVALPEPAESDLVEVDPDNLPGLKVMLAVGFAFADDDGDGAYDDGEVFLGAAADRWAAYVGGVVPEGWTEGWQLADLHMGEEGDTMPDFYPLEDGVEIELIGLPLDSTTIGGTWTATSGGEGPAGPGPGTEERLVLLGLVLDETGELTHDLATSHAETSLAKSWSLDLDFVPGDTYEFPDDEGNGFALSGAMFFGAPYVDKDQDGAYAFGAGRGADELTGATICSASGMPVLPIYVEPPTTAWGGLVMPALGIRAGWNLFEQTEGDEGAPSLLDPADYGTLVIESACSMDGGEA